MVLTCCSKPVGRPTNSSEQMDFVTLFTNNCSGCHGVGGKNGAAQSLHDSLYLTLAPKDELTHVITKGRPGTSMPAFAESEGGGLSDKQIGDLIEGIEKWRGPADVNGESLPPYESSLTGDSGRGRQLFAAHCTVCHQAKGIGVIDDPNYLSLVSNQSLRTTMIVGRPALGMPNWRTLNSGKTLADQDIADVTAYLTSRRPKASFTQTQGEQQIPQ
jgi:cytochrome c oxidase cbb3-type subunit III